MFEYLPTIFALIIGILAVLYIYCQRQLTCWKRKGFPHTNPSFPWGDMKGIAKTRSVTDIATHVYNSFPHERFVGFNLFLKPALLVKDPDLLRLIMVKEFGSFHDRGAEINLDDNVLAAHLLNLTGKKWKNLRAKLTPTFSSGKIKLMLPIMVECSDQLKKVLEEPASRREVQRTQVVEMKDFLARLTTDIISLAAFGMETDSLNNKDAEFWHYGQNAFDQSPLDALKEVIYATMPWLGKFLHLRILPEDVTNFFLGTFRQNMKYREENNIKRNDFFDLIIQMLNQDHVIDETDEKETKITFNVAAAQAYVFFMAGFETSSSAMQFIVYELARNPGIQEKARDEVQRVLTKHNGEITYEAVMEMEYLGRVIDESLRMYPSASILFRSCSKDWKIPDSNLVIPKGALLLVDVYGMHHDSRHFPNPDRFDPGRFTEEAKAKRHNFCYLPFGEGPRMCIGLRFGLLQARVSMLTLLRYYRFSVSNETPIPMVFDPKAFFLSAKGGMHVRIEKLDDDGLSNS